MCVDLCLKKSEKNSMPKNRLHIIQFEGLLQYKQCQGLGLWTIETKKNRKTLLPFGFHVANFQLTVLDKLHFS